VNTAGELIGINSQILSPSGGNIGIGLAIPSNMARAVMDQLRKTGTVRRGMIGVTIQPLNADLAQSLNLPSARGAIITSVQSGGPADKGGIRRGDVITRFNGQPIMDSNNLRNLIASAAPGSEETLTLMRDGREQNVLLILGELPTRARQDTDTGSPEPSQSPDKFGLTLQPLTPDLASRLGLGDDEQGVVVSAVDPSGAAADAGIIRGDVIQEVNRQPVRTPRDFNASIARSGTKPALVLINRRGTVLYLTLRPQ
jgi:S1-C subfamily serine protease